MKGAAGLVAEALAEPRRPAPICTFAGSMIGATW
jgi:hypothetical protein